MLGQSHNLRITKLEDRFAAVEDRLDGVDGRLGGIESAVTKIADGMSTTGERAAERAQAVKMEIRDETDRKTKERGSLITSGLAILGAVFMVVAAFCGPYLNKINATSDASADSIIKLGAIREVLAQQGADVGRNRDAIDIARDKNRLQDEQIRQLAHDQAYLEGWMSAKHGYPGR